MNNIFNCSGMIIAEASENDAVKAYAYVTVNDELVIKGIRVFENDCGLQVRMPALINEDGKYDEVISLSLRRSKRALRETVLRAYNNMKAAGIKRMPLRKGSPQTQISNDIITVTLEKCGGNNAVGSAVINNDLVFHDITVTPSANRTGGIFIELPKIRRADGVPKNTVDVNNAFYDKLRKAVTLDYSKLLENCN